MKNKILFLFTIASVFGMAQNVAINATGAAPAASAMLDIASTTSGILAPRMTTAQRTAIVSPATGLLVYDTSLNAFLYFDGTIWRLMAYSGGWLLAGNTLTGTEFMGSVNAANVRFFSNNAERFRIASTGEVVVGSTTPLAGDVFSAYGAFPVNGYGTGVGSIGSYGSSNSNTGFGIFGGNSNATGTGGIFSGNGIGAGYLTLGSGIASTGTSTAVYGRATNVAGGTGGVFAGNNAVPQTLVAGSGVSGAGTTFGVYGRANNVANNTWGGYFTNGNGDFAYVGGRTAAGVLRKIEGSGTVNTVVKDLEGKQVLLSCPEAPENFFQDFGQGKLINGRVHITIDPIFSKNIVVNEKHPLRVFIQLKGDCNGVFVTNEDANGFDVVELKSGNSNVSFSYFITANRADEVFPDNSVSKYSEERFAPSMGLQKTVEAEVKVVDQKIQQEKEKK